jgi:hypothetical protein
MIRSRDINECPVCKQPPKIDKYGRLGCECPGRFWQYKAGTVGSPEDRQLLLHHGWQLIEIPNDIYWVGPAGNILYLHDGGTWNCDTAPKRFTELQEYLEWYASKLRDAFLDGH